MTTDETGHRRRQGTDPAPHPAAEEADRRGEGEHRADGHRHHAGHRQGRQLNLVERVRQGEPGRTARSTAARSTRSPRPRRSGSRWRSAAGVSPPPRRSARREASVGMRRGPAAERVLIPSLTPDPLRRDRADRSGLAGPDERNDLGDQRRCGHEQHDQRLQHGGQGERGLGDALHGQSAGVQRPEQQPRQHRAERFGPAQQRHRDGVEADGADDARPTAAPALPPRSGPAPPAPRPARPARRPATMLITVVRPTLMPAVAAACGLAPTARMAKPIVERSRIHQTAPAANREMRKPRCSWLPSSRGMVAFQSRSARSDRSGPAAGRPTWSRSRPAAQRRCSSS